MLGLKTEITGVVTENASAVGLCFAASKPVPIHSLRRFSTQR
jgi:hypothetical protein